MKLETFEIHFENPRGVFSAGDQVKGHVIVKLRNPMKIRKISLYFEGRSKSHWEVRHGRSKTDYRANETYICETFELYDMGQGGADHPAGDHSYTFCLQLPSTLPSSFEGRRGYVRYFCKASINRPWKFDEHTKRAFTVIHHLDLNVVPTAGLVTYTGYSNSIFSSGHPKHHTKLDTFSLFSTTNRIKKNCEEHINRAAPVPALPPSRLEGCGIIDISYFVGLKVHVRWTTVTLEREIVIGTVPMRFVPSRESASPARSIATAPSAPPMEPPPYSEPPPSYEESVFGRVEIRDENDDEHTSGQMGWAPSYPVYHYDAARQHFQILPAVPAQEVPSGAPPAYNQI
ncbi:arrestin domain-containing protein 2-like isoform X2 [Pomacea canaliculata]|uniref:arrestin domain-containing protein 2-like isoform X2 n=1 Tax=Pomacea canaliculata TaxID=400727 RepID=UPI000D72BB07|nr:arrestin domain-containing protein 2-like isoform X2 [Pomacea canaliculata]